MKNIRLYAATKYSCSEYEEVEPGIYKTYENEEYDMDNENLIYVTSLMFEQEPEFGENAPSDDCVSQYPLETILEDFCCWCGDFYDKENAEDKCNSYVEFVSDDIEPIRDILSFAGKHVYMSPDWELIIE